MKALRSALALCAALFAIAVLSNARAAQPAKPVEVLILGVYHFDNPGLDVANVEVDDVTAPHRQKELAALAQTLLRFKPTKIAVEESVKAADLKSPGFAKFDDATLKSSRNETAQIGYRLAKAAGHGAVYGIDEQSDTIDYFPFGPVQAYAEANGKTAQLTALIETIQTRVAEFGAAARNRPIGRSLAALNAPSRLKDEHDSLYYGMIAIGGAKETPGADLNAAWYWRNARIFAKLQAISEPGDRIIVVYGSGHAYWLRHFVESTPGFTLVETQRYLPR